MTHPAVTDVGFAAALGANRGRYTPESPSLLSDLDLAVLDCFMRREAFAGNRLVSRAGRATAFGTHISVLWLDGAPVAHLQQESSFRKSFSLAAAPGTPLAEINAALQAARGERFFFTISDTVFDGAAAFTRSFARDLTTGANDEVAVHLALNWTELDRTLPMVIYGGELQTDAFWEAAGHPALDGATVAEIMIAKARELGFDPIFACHDSYGQDAGFRAADELAASEEGIIALALTDHFPAHLVPEFMKADTFVTLLPVFDADVAAWRDGQTT